MLACKFDNPLLAKLGKSGGGVVFLCYAVQFLSLFSNLLWVLSFLKPFLLIPPHLLVNLPGFLCQALIHLVSACINNPADLILIHLTNQIGSLGFPPHRVLIATTVDPLCPQL